LGYGASRRSSFVCPYLDDFDSEKKYLICFHPHGMLLDGMHSVIAKNTNLLESGIDGKGHPTQRAAALCFAPVIQSIPVHSEMYRELSSDASKQTVEGWWKKSTPSGKPIDPVIAPGGFAECCFCDAGDPDIDYHYLKGRLGFMRIAIENKADIAPIYSFNVSNMYYNFPYLKGARARISQKIFLGMSWPIGKFGTFMPLTDWQTNMWFPPFPASKYRIEQLEEAHEAYLKHLEKYFDLHKAEYGQADCKLQFVGKDYVDEDPLANIIFPKRWMRSKL